MYPPGMRISDGLAIVGTIDPVSHTSGTRSSDVIDMRLYHRVAAIVLSGALAAGGTLDLTAVGDTASGGAFATTLTDKSTAAATFSGSAAGSDRQAWIEVDAAEVEAQGLRYVRFDLVAAGSGGHAAVLILGVPRYAPATGYDLASVAEVVD